MFGEQWNCSLGGEIQVLNPESKMFMVIMLAQQRPIEHTWSSRMHSLLPSWTSPCHACTLVSLSLGDDGIDPRCAASKECSITQTMSFS